MTKMYILVMDALGRFRRDDEGVTLVEYGIALVLAVTVGTFLLTQLGVSVLGEMTAANTILTTNG